MQDVGKSSTAINIDACRQYYTHKFCVSDVVSDNDRYFRSNIKFITFLEGNISLVGHVF